MSTDETRPDKPEDPERRSFLQGMAAGSVLLSHNADSSWFDGWFDDSHETSSDGPGFLQDMVIQQEGNTIAADPEIIDYIGPAVDEIEKYETPDGDTKVKIKLVGGDGYWSTTDDGAVTPDEGRPLNVDGLSTKSSPSNVVIYKDGSTVIARAVDDPSVGEIASGTNAASVINSAIIDQGSYTLIEFSKQKFDVTETIIIPDGTVGVVLRGPLPKHQNEPTLDASSMSNDTVIDNQNTDICFVGVERLFIEGDSAQGTVTHVDHSGSQDSWVTGCFLLRGDYGVIPGNNCWIEGPNQWIEYFIAGIRDSTGVKSNFYRANLFAGNTADILKDGSGDLTRSVIANNRSGTAGAFIKVTGGRRLRWSTIGQNTIYDISDTAYHLDNGEIASTSIVGDSIYANGNAGTNVFKITNGGFFRSSVDINAVTWDGLGGSIVNGDPNHWTWNGVVDGGPMGGGPLDGNPVQRYDGVTAMADGSNSTTGGQYSLWTLDTANSQWVRVDGQETFAI